MSSITERLINDLATAMRDKDTSRRDVLRYIRSQLHNEEIERGRDLTDEETTAVIQREVKQRRESIEQFEKGQRQDLVDAENAQIAILQEYLPPQLTEEELERVAHNLAAQLELSGSKDMGKLMGPLREEVGPRAEGRAIADAARRVLDQRENDRSAT